MQRTFNAQTQRYEKIIAEQIIDVVRELRCTELADLVGFAWSENLICLDDIVSSAIELFFKPGILKFGYGANLDMAWGKPPCIDFDMEFSNQGIDANFCLRICGDHGAVQVNYLTFAADMSNPEQELLALSSALEDGRIGVYGERISRVHENILATV